MFDFLMLGFYHFGLYLVLLLLTAKLSVLIIYKKNNWSYIFSRLFLYHHSYVVRSEDYKRWGYFRTITNLLTFGIHLSLICWALSYFFYSSITA